jgi:AcrR family transcriptional regulator
MAQYKKEETQNLIIQSAEKLFASKGYRNTTISDIAKAAGISVGNMYRYYKSKEQILDEILPEEFVKWMQEKLHNKILTGKSESIIEQSEKKEYIEKSEEFYKIIIANRLKLMILLQYSKETPYESFRKCIVENLVDFVWKQFAQEEDQLQVKRDLLDILYDGYIQMILNIVSKKWDEKKMLKELKLLNDYHIIGLGAVLERKRVEK